MTVRKKVEGIFRVLEKLLCWMETDLELEGPGFFAPSSSQAPS